MTTIPSAPPFQHIGTDRHLQNSACEYNGPMTTPIDHIQHNGPMFPRPIMQEIPASALLCVPTPQAEIYCGFDGRRISP